MRELPVRPAAVTAEDLTLSYGPRVALAPSSFEIPSGGITVLIGPNGSGKSTLLAAIAGLVQPSSGRIAVKTANGDVRNRISFVLQSTTVNETLPVTVREVVTMGRYAGNARRRISPEDRAAVEDAMRRMDITGLAGMHLSELSGGQRQRVLVAQGLAQDHDILLLDEPLTGLDLPSAQAIDQVIHDETQTGCTIVMTTHDLAEAQVADHVILLSGRVVASGPADSVLTVENLTEAYGPNLLHVEGERLFIDDPAHRPVARRHVHRDHSG